MADDLKIEIGTDVLNVIKSLDTLQTEFKALQKTIAQTTDGKELIQLNKRLDNLGATIKAIKSAGKTGFDDFGQKIAGIKKPVGDASNALLNFGRIAQDAPFGIIGITNNINPALESFQRLAKETGSTGAALKALGAGLLGPAGVGVAISIVTSAITGLVLKYGSLNNAIKEIFGNMTAAEKVMRDYNKALSESLGSNLADASNLKNLLAVAKDVTLSTEARKNAIEEINNKYPQYLKNLSLETINTDKTSESIAKQIQLLNLQGEQKAIQNVLEKKYTELLENGSKELLFHATTLQQIKGFLKNQFFGDIGGYPRLIKDATTEYLNQNKVINDQIKLLQEQGIEVTKSIAKIGGFKIIPEKTAKDIKKTIVFLQEGLTPLEIPVEFSDKKKFDVKQIIHGIESVDVSKAFGGKSIFDIIGYDDQGKAIHKASVEAFNNFKEFWEKENAKDPLKLKVDTTLKNSTTIDSSGIIDDAKRKEALKKAQDFTNEVNQIIKSGMADALSGVGESIANIISNGSNGLDAFRSIGITLANVLINVGKAAIAAGLATEAIKKALETFKGYGAIAAGVALVALGGVIRNNLAKAAPGMATGGIVPPGFPNDTFPARLSSNEAVIPLDRIDGLLGDRGGFSGGILTARISGSDLLFTLERASRTQKRGGFRRV